MRTCHCGNPLPKKRLETCSWLCAVKANQDDHVRRYAGSKTPAFLAGKFVKMEPPTEDERAAMRVGFSLSWRFNKIAASQKRVDG